MYDFSTVDRSRLDDYQKEALDHKPINDNILIVVAFRAQQLSNVLHMKTFDQFVQMPMALEDLTLDEEATPDAIWSDDDALRHLRHVGGRTVHYLLQSMSEYGKFADGEESRALETLRSVFRARVGDETYDSCYARLFEGDGSAHECEPCPLLRSIRKNDESSGSTDGS